MREFANQNKRRRFTASACGKRGFTLIEVMVTLLILAFGMLASVTGIMASLDHGRLNEMRNEAIKIAQEQQEAARNMDFSAIPAIPAQQTITRQLRKNNVSYTVSSTSTLAPAAVGLAMRMVEFKVQWTFKKGTHSYVLQTIVRQLR